MLQRRSLSLWGVARETRRDCNVLLLTHRSFDHHAFLFPCAKYKHFQCPNDRRAAGAFGLVCARRVVRTRRNLLWVLSLLLQFRALLPARNLVRFPTTCKRRWMSSKGSARSRI